LKDAEDQITIEVGHQYRKLIEARKEVEVVNPVGRNPRYGFPKLHRDWTKVWFNRSLQSSHNI
jgi:hypothetical protein